MVVARTHFTYHVDMWTPDGESVVEHIADVEDYQAARPLPRCLRTLAWYAHHVAARRVCDRGQPALAPRVTRQGRYTGAKQRGFAGQFVGRVADKLLSD